MTADELLDHTPRQWRKHAGKTASEVSDIDPSYVVWAYETWHDKPCSKLLYDACLKEVLEERNQRRVERDQDHD